MRICECVFDCGERGVGFVGGGEPGLNGGKVGAMSVALDLNKESAPTQNFWNRISHHSFGAICFLIWPTNINIIRFLIS